MYPLGVCAGALLDIEDGVGGVHGSLVLGRLTDETLLGGEGDERGSGEATLLVGDCKKLRVSMSCGGSERWRRHTDLNVGALIVGNARVGGACRGCQHGEQQA